MNDRKQSEETGEPDSPRQELPYTVDAGAEDKSTDDRPVRLGRIKPGTRYTVEVATDDENTNLNFVFIGLQPVPGAAAFSYQMVVQGGRAGQYTGECPPASNYRLITILVDQPEGSHATLEVSGLLGDTPKKQVRVSRTRTYWMEIAAS